MMSEHFLINIMKVFSKDAINEDLLTDDRHVDLVYRYGLFGLTFMQSVLVANEHIRMVDKNGLELSDNDMFRLISMTLK